jgi:hypothetical protein
VRSRLRLLRFPSRTVPAPGEPATSEAESAASAGTTQRRPTSWLPDSNAGATEASASISTASRERQRHHVAEPAMTEWLLPGAEPWPTPAGTATPESEAMLREASDAAWAPIASSGQATFDAPGRPVDPGRWTLAAGSPSSETIESDQEPARTSSPRQREQAVVAYLREFAEPDGVAMPEPSSALRAAIADLTVSNAQLLRSARSEAASTYSRRDSRPGWRRKLAAEHEDECAETAVLLARRAEGNLDADGAKRLGHHLRKCLRCATVQIRAERAGRAFVAAAQMGVATTAVLGSAGVAEPGTVEAAKPATAIFEPSQEAAPISGEPAEEPLVERPRPKVWEIPAAFAAEHALEAAPVEAPAARPDPEAEPKLVAPEVEPAPVPPPAEEAPVAAEALAAGVAATVGAQPALGSATSDAPALARAESEEPPFLPSGARTSGRARRQRVLAFGLAGVLLVGGAAASIALSGHGNGVSQSGATAPTVASAPTSTSATTTPAQPVKHRSRHTALRRHKPGAAHPAASATPTTVASVGGGTPQAPVGTSGGGGGVAPAPANAPAQPVQQSAPPAQQNPTTSSPPNISVSQPSLGSSPAPTQGIGGGKK